MKRNIVVAALIAGMTGLAGSAVSHAQVINSQCAVGETQDACQKAIDAFRYMGSQLGTVISGGNATLGQGGTLGGFPHFRVGLRATVMRSSLPKLEDQAISTTGAVSSNYSTESQWIGLPQLDAAIGVFSGYNLGLTRVGGVDLLLSMAYLPTITQDDFTLSGSTKIGAGFRLGLFQEGLLFPGVSFTYLRRDLPAKAGFNSSIGNDSISIDGITVKTDAWRVVASKNLLVFGLAAGFGKDRYTSDGTFMVDISSTGTTLPETSIRQTVSRNNLFLNVAANFFLVQVVGEIGQVSGGNTSTFNTFDKGPNSSRTYGSIGLKAGF